MAPAVRPDGRQHGETSALLILLGGAYLYLKGMIRLRAPLTCLGLFAAVIWIFGGPAPFTGDAAAHLLSGGLMLAAFFMVTDYTTKPVTPWGEVLFAGGWERSPPCCVCGGLIRRGSASRF